VIVAPPTNHGPRRHGEARQRAAQRERLDLQESDVEAGASARPSSGGALPPFGSTYQPWNCPLSGSSTN